MHGGAKGSGAPYGNQNGLKHGLYSKFETERRKEVNDVLKTLESLQADLLRG